MASQAVKPCLAGAWTSCSAQPVKVTNSSEYHKTAFIQSILVVIALFFFERQAGFICGDQ
jgi:hypothetical protein